MAAAEEAVRAKEVEADEAATKAATVAMPTVAKPPARLPAQPLVPALPPEDSPTVVDMIPAFAVVDVDAATAHYRGARRRGGWTRYPLGAIAVGVVLVLITF